MNNLRLENSDKIKGIIETYSKDNNLEYDFITNEIYGIITEEIENSTHFDLISQKWQKESEQTKYATEEEIFHVVSIDIEKEIRDELLKEIDEEELEELNKFLVDNYKSIFKDFYKKYKTINEDDFDDCVLAVSKSYEINENIAEIFVSMFVEKEILNLSF